MDAPDVHTYDFRGRLQIRSCRVARYTMTQSLGQSDYDRFTREYSTDECGARQLSVRVRANKAKRNEIIFDFRLRPEAEPPHRLIYGSELGDGMHH